jgi:ADP-heptose:LPS heptosyltransferase
MSASPEGRRAAPRPERLRIVVVRALPGLGDFLCAVPALRALRDHDVTYVGLPQTRPLAERFGAYVSRHLDFPGWPGIPEVEPDAEALSRLRDDVAGADLALQLHGSGVASAGFVQALGAARTGGFVPVGAPLPGPGWLLWSEAESEVRRLLRLLEHLNLPTDGPDLEFPISAEEEREAAALDLPRPYAVVHPGSSLPNRRWPAERFAQTADALASEGLTPVLTGTPAEADAVAAVTELAQTRPVSLVGRTSLGALAAVLRDAAVVVTNDTGTSHLAAAVQAPSVVVHTVTDPVRWAPVDRNRHRPLAGDVSVDAVLRQAESLRAVGARSPGSDP